MSKALRDSYSADIEQTFAHADQVFANRTSRWYRFSRKSSGSARIEADKFHAEAVTETREMEKASREYYKKGGKFERTFRGGSREATGKTTLREDQTKEMEKIRQAAKRDAENAIRETRKQAKIAESRMRNKGKDPAEDKKLGQRGLRIKPDEGVNRTYTPGSFMSQHTAWYSGQAYNMGVVSADKDAKFFRVSDGTDCGLTNHDDPTKANGMVVTRAEAKSYPLAHANCARTFHPIPEDDGKKAWDRQNKAKKAAAAKVRRAKAAEIAKKAQRANELIGFTKAVTETALRQGAYKQLLRDRDFLRKIDDQLDDMLDELASSNLDKVLDLRTGRQFIPLKEDLVDDIMIHAERWVLEGDPLPRHVQEVLGLTDESSRRAIGDRLKMFNQYAETFKKSELPGDIIDGIEDFWNDAYWAARASGHHDEFRGLVRPDRLSAKLSIPRIGKHRTLRATQSFGFMDNDIIKFSSTLTDQLKFMTADGLRSYAERIGYSILKEGKVGIPEVKSRRELIDEMGGFRLGALHRVTINPSGLFRVGLGLDPSGYIVPNFRLVPKGPVRASIELAKPQKISKRELIQKARARGLLGAHGGMTRTELLSLLGEPDKLVRKVNTQLRLVPGGPIKFSADFSNMHLQSLVAEMRLFSGRLMGSVRLSERGISVAGSAGLKDGNILGNLGRARIKTKISEGGIRITREVTGLGPRAARYLSDMRVDVFGINEELDKVLTEIKTRRAIHRKFDNADNRARLEFLRKKKEKLQKDMDRVGRTQEVNNILQQKMKAVSDKIPTWTTERIQLLNSNVFQIAEVLDIDWEDAGVLVRMAEAAYERTIRTFRHPKFDDVVDELQDMNIRGRLDKFRDTAEFDANIDRIYDELGAVPPEFIEDLEQHLSAIESMFPNLPAQKWKLEDLKGYDPKDGSGEWMAYSPKTNTLIVDRRVAETWTGRHRQVFSDAAQADMFVNSGYPDPIHLLSHETGHQMDMLLRVEDRASVWADIINSADPDFERLPDVWEGLEEVREALAGVDTDEDINRALSDFLRKGSNRQVFIDNVSRYGASNPREAFAEMFGEYMTSSSPRPMANAVGRRMEQIYGRNSKFKPDPDTLMENWKGKRFKNAESDIRHRPLSQVPEGSSIVREWSDEVSRERDDLINNITSFRDLDGAHHSKHLLDLSMDWEDTEIFDMIQDFILQEAEPESFGDVSHNLDALKKYLRTVKFLDTRFTNDLMTERPLTIRVKTVEELSGDSGGAVLGQYDPDTAEIVLVREMFEDPEGFESIYLKTLDVGNIGEDISDVSTALVHEFGHYIHDMVSNSPDHQGILDEIAEGIVEAFELSNSKEINDLVRWGSIDDPEREAFIWKKVINSDRTIRVRNEDPKGQFFNKLPSHYGRTNVYEAIAESFLQYLVEPRQSEMSRIVGRAFDRGLTHIDDEFLFSRISPDELRDAQRARIESRIAELEGAAPDAPEARERLSGLSQARFGKLSDRAKAARERLADAAEERISEDGRFSGVRGRLRKDPDAPRKSGSPEGSDELVELRKELSRVENASVFQLGGMTEETEGFVNFLSADLDLKERLGDKAAESLNKTLRDICKMIEAQVPGASEEMFFEYGAANVRPTFNKAGVPNTGVVDGNWDAHFSGERKIILSDKLISSFGKKYDAHYAKSQEVGFNVPGTGSSNDLVAHEFGHMAHDYAGDHKVIQFLDDHFPGALEDLISMGETGVVPERLSDYGLYSGQATDKLEIIEISGGYNGITREMNPTIKMFKIKEGAWKDFGLIQEADLERRLSEALPEALREAGLEGVSYDPTKFEPGDFFQYFLSDSGQITSRISPDLAPVLKKLLSEYGTTMVEEMVAEGFSEYAMTRDPRAVSRVIGEWIMDNIDRKVSLA